MQDTQSQVFRTLQPRAPSPAPHFPRGKGSPREASSSPKGAQRVGRSWEQSQALSALIPHHVTTSRWNAWGWHCVSRRHLPFRLYRGCWVGHGRRGSSPVGGLGWEVRGAGGAEQ